MAGMLDKYIDPDMQRKLIYVLLAAVSLSYVFFLAPAFWWMKNEIYGSIDIGTIVGAIAAAGLWRIYKRRI